MTIEEKRAFVSDLAAKFYATGMSGDEAAVLAYAALEEFEREFSAMTPQQRALRVGEALLNRALGV